MGAKKRKGDKRGETGERGKRKREESEGTSTCPRNIRISTGEDEFNITIEQMEEGKGTSTKIEDAVVIATMGMVKFVIKKINEK